MPAVAKSSLSAALSQSNTTLHANHRLPQAAYYFSAAVQCQRANALLQSSAAAAGTASGGGGNTAKEAESKLLKATDVSARRPSPHTTAGQPKTE